MMMMGGGSDPPPAPPPPDPRAEAEAQIELERQLAEIRRQEAAQERQRQEAEEAARRQGRATAIETGRTSARGGIESELTRRGLDPATYGSDIDQYIGDIIAGIPSGAYGTDVPTFFAGDLASPFISGMETRQRGDLNRSLDAFAAPGFAQELYGGTEDDAIIDAIIADQFGSATDQLNRAFSRGTLNQAGLDTALARLGEQRTAAGSRLQSIGGGLLEGFREQARGRVGTARDRIGSLSLGQTFDPASVQSSLQEQRTSNLGRLEGDIRSAIGGEPLFDTSDLILRGGISQGIINPARGGEEGAALQGAFRRRREEEDRTRGIGTQGVI